MKIDGNVFENLKKKTHMQDTHCNIIESQILSCVLQS